MLSRWYSGLTSFYVRGNHIPTDFSMDSLPGFGHCTYKNYEVLCARKRYASNSHQPLICLRHEE